ncbi:TonB-dependent receptor [Bacteroidetes/Chlorobi group bacterium ChocPot_Mid]|nr:MAG: TonB-dependent receptor [Bacteroidetes/Chlorobi group bacterium ChocPot_Mid]
MNTCKIVLLILFLGYVVTYSQSETKKATKDSLSFRTSEIVISALRYPEKKIEVPMAISTISRTDILLSKSTGIEEALQNVPGVLAQSRAGSNDVRVTIRGFGARGAGDRSNSGTSRGIKFYWNGIPQTEPDGRTSFDFLDMNAVEDIEVIRSNASAIWGNAAGGVISFSTIPDFQKSSLEIVGQGGSYGYNSLFAKANSKMESGFLNTTFSKSKYDGWRQNSESERYLFNLAMLSNLSENTNMKVFLSGVSNKFNIPGPLTIDTYNNAPDSANDYYLKRKERRFNRAVQMGINLEHNFNENNVVSGMFFVNPKYLQRSERNTFRDFVRYHLGGNINYKNNYEISETIKNILLIGLDEQYQDGSILFYNLDDKAERGSTLKDNKREGANSAGLFLQDELVFSDKISAILGVRYDDVTYYSESFIAGDKLENRSFSKVTPKFAISYRLNETHSLYVNYGGGIEVPAGNETDPAPYLGMDTLHLINPLLEPIVSTTYEIGSKNYDYFESGLIDMLHYEIAAFLINTENEIIPYKGGKFYFSAGKTQRIGGEVGIGGKFFKSLDLSVNLTYMKSKYVDYKIDSVYYSASKAGIYGDYSDNSIAGIPELMYFVKLKYVPTFFDNVFIEGSCQGVGEYYVDDANEYNNPSFTIFNLKFGTAQAIKLFDNLGVNLYFSINNLLDAKYSSSAFINPDKQAGTNLPYYLEPGLPRNFQFGLSVNFN